MKTILPQFLTAVIALMICMAVPAKAQDSEYYKFISPNNGLSVTFQSDLKVTCDDESKLEIENDNFSFTALFCDAATISKLDMKDNLEKVIKKSGIDKKSLSLLELNTNKTLQGSLYIGGNKVENADYYLIYGFVQSKLSPQIAFKISVICNSNMAKQAGTLLGTLEFNPESIK